MTYALLVQNLDGEERKKFDRELHAHDEKDSRALAALFAVPAERTGAP